jgi:uncharacterized protein YhaN
MRLRLAHTLLSKAIASYQERTQDPLLKLASTWFARITGDRYKKLGVDYDDDFQILVVERRADGRRLRVSQLSEGTTDQLYLALRLAALEQRLESSAAMPLVLDDALLTFDDERAASALKALAELGEKNQVLFFTHHQHLVDIASEAVPKGKFAVQELATA